MTSQSPSRGLDDGSNNLVRTNAPELGLFVHTAPSHGWDHNVKQIFDTVLNDDRSEIERDMCALVQ